MNVLPFPELPMVDDDWIKEGRRPPSPWDLERRIALLEQSSQNIRDELHKINSNISKLVWIVLSAVIIGGLNLILTQGGG